MIPKIIHQTWKDNKIPDNWIDAVESCKLNGYKYILWTDKTMEEFVKNNYQNFYQYYKSYKYTIQKCDAFRYLVLYKYGGIYLDMDIVCKKNLDNLLNNEIVLARSANLDKSYTNSFFMIIPKHPFFKYCVDNLPKYMNSYSKFGKHLHVMNSTGPLFLTKMLNNYEDFPKYVLSKEEFAGKNCNICNENNCKGGIYFKHILGQSWNEFDSKLYNYILCNKYYIGFFIIVIILYFCVYRKKTKK